MSPLSPFAPAGPEVTAPGARFAAVIEPFLMSLPVRDWSLTCLPVMRLAASAGRPLEPTATTRAVAPRIVPREGRFMVSTLGASYALHIGENPHHRQP